MPDFAILQGPVGSFRSAPPVRSSGGRHVKVRRARTPGLLRCCLLTLVLVVRAGVAADEGDPDGFVFDDRPLQEPVEHPSWFKLSFLDLREDLADTISEGKAALIVYFGQDYCPYCRNLLEINFGLEDIAGYTRARFDVVAIDARGKQRVTGLDGRHWTEREYASHQGLDFTPSLLFYDAAGREALRLRGYYPPYQFRAALEYVADEHYLLESFPEYLERGSRVFSVDASSLNEEDFFMPPPHMLDRSRFGGERPLAVFFEQSDCHACNVLHGGPLQEASLVERLQAFDVVQLDMRADTPVVTPAGARTTARDWARELGLFYAPTLLFFDEAGDEIIRVDSVVQFYRLNQVLEYVRSKAYRSYPTYQDWRGEQRGG